MSITIRSAQTIRNGVTIRGNDTQIPPPPPTIITDGLVLHYDFSDAEVAQNFNYYRARFGI